MVGIGLFSLIVTTLDIVHIGINQKPTFSYIIITMSSSKFEFEQRIADKMVFLVIKRANMPKTKEVKWDEDRFFKKATFSEVVEADKRSVLIAIHLRKRNIRLNVTRSGSSILVFGGTTIPFVGKEDIENYMRSSVETKNYGAIDILFDLIESEDPEISAKALLYLGEMFFRMGVEAREIQMILKSAYFYSNAARKFFNIGEIERAVESKLLSSKAFRTSGFYPEARFQAESGLEYLASATLPVEKADELYIKLVCSQAISLVGMNKIGEALLLVERLKGRAENLSGDAYDCYWAALGVIEFEKGEFERSAELISYVSDKFIKEEPIVLPRYVKSLIKTNRSYLAKRYAGYMLTSLLPELKPEGLLLLAEVLIQDGDFKNSLRFVYRLITDFAGTRWEIRGRLFAVLNRDKYMKIVKELSRKDIPPDDPVSFPVQNLRFVITAFLSPETQIAFREYLKIIEQNIRRDNIEEVQRDINFLRRVVPVVRALKTPPDISMEISEAMYNVLKKLYENDHKIRAFSFYVENKDMLPPRYAKDYSFIDSIHKEFVQTDDTQFEIAQVERLTEESKCSEAYEKIKRIKDKIEPQDYSRSILKVALCFFSKKDPNFRRVCEENVEELEPICFPKFPEKSTTIERIDQLVEEIIKEYEGVTEEVREKLGY